MCLMRGHLNVNLNLNLDLNLNFKSPAHVPFKIRNGGAQIRCQRRELIVDWCSSARVHKAKNRALLKTSFAHRQRMQEWIKQSQNSHIVRAIGAVLLAGLAIKNASKRVARAWRNANITSVLWNDVANGRQKLPIQVRSRHPSRRPVFQRFTSMIPTEGDEASNSSTFGLHVEDLEFKTDHTMQGWVPLKIIRPHWNSSMEPLPVAILLHPTGANKEFMLGLMTDFARMGYLTAAIDCRYHGARADPRQGCRECYQQSLVSAWRYGKDRPFLLDNVWDLVHLLDYLETREDADSDRMGILGISLGGMHAWLCSVLDARVKVAVPIIGVQNFGWAVDNEKFHGRVESIPTLFQTAMSDMGKGKIDSEVVRAVWEKLAPGLLDVYDAPHSLPLIAPRPLLVINGEDDPRCPVQGLTTVIEKTANAYERMGCKENFCMRIEKGVGHSVTENMKSTAKQWFNRHLLGSAEYM